MKWLLEKRDPLWVASQQSLYRQIVTRAAAGIAGLRDDEWLPEALRILDLTYLDYESDLSAVRRGETSPRMNGEWPDLPGLIQTEIDDEGIVEVED